MQKLNQVVAIEKATKNEVGQRVNSINRTLARDGLFTGFHKSYESKDEEGMILPAESRKVENTAKECMKFYASEMTKVLDITATKDYANCNAMADVVVDGEVLLENVPTTYLLYLEKQINEIKAFVSMLPVLEASENWTEDINTGLYKTDVVQTHRTKKVKKPIVLYPATDRHPAQTEMITEDIIEGYWNTVKNSGAMPNPEKLEILEKLQKLSNAVKYARESANMTPAPTQYMGQKVFKYLFD